MLQYICKENHGYMLAVEAQIDFTYRYELYLLYVCDFGE